MPSFTYTARNSNGELKSATIDAPSRDEVVAQLRRQRLTIIKVDESKTTPKKNLGSIKMRDIVIFTRQFSTMINAGLPLVQALDIPFREAHHITGRIVGIASARGVDLDKVTLAEMQGVEPRITEAVYSVLGVVKSVKSRTSYGGTAPANVRRQAQGWRRRLAREKA